MSQNYYKKAHWLIFLFIPFATIVCSQNLSITTTGTCSNASDGSISVKLDSSLLGDYPLPYMAEWENITNGEYSTFFFNSLTDTITGLSAGDYELVIALNAICEIYLETTVESYALHIQSLTPTCICPGGYGSAEVEVSGGSGNYAYAWKTAPGNGISDPTVANPLIYDPGSYTVMVTDSETGCEVSGTVEVQVCNIDLSSLLAVQPDCNEEGTSTLSIQLPASYGLPPYEFKWIRPGLGVVEVDASEDGYADLKNAMAGEYCLSVLTQNGCSEQICGIVVETQPAPQIDYSVIPVVNENDGTITLNVTGQPGPFTYQWDSGQTTPSISGLSTGTYCVTVTDQGSACTATACIDLTDCETLGLMIDPLKANVTAITSANGIQTGGAIDIINVLDQFPGYDFNFQWSNGANTEDISGLEAGIYSVLVTSTDCPFLLGQESWEICQFSLKFTQQDLNCNQTSLSVLVSMEGDYLYNWSTGETSNKIIASYGSSYCVTVSEFNGCSAVACYTPQGSELSINLIELQEATFGNSDGYIEVSANGGFGPYTYNWSNGMNGPAINGLPPGIYAVTVTDACGNNAENNYIIQCEFGPGEIFAQVTDVDCTTSHHGEIIITQLPTGIQNPFFIFNWSNGSTTQNISDLSVGEYCVTVTEITTGCTASKCFSVGGLGNANFDIGFDVNPSCYPLENGSITAIPSNINIGPFDYEWGSWSWGPPSTNFENDATIQNIPAGWYYVTVTDAFGCTSSGDTFLWPAQAEFGASPAEDPLFVCPDQTGSIELSVWGSYDAPLSFFWANYSEYPLVYHQTGSPNIDGLQSGNWAVTISDASGCQAYSTFSVRETDIKVIASLISGCDGEGAIDLVPEYGIYSFAPFTYLWSSGENTPNISGLSDGQFAVTITDALGCTSENNYIIETDPVPIYVKVDPTDDFCSDTDCTGSLEVVKLFYHPSNESGTPPYSYDWSDGSQSAKINNLCPGTYQVTVTSALGCSSTGQGIVGNNGIICDAIFETYTQVNGGSYRWDFPGFHLWANKQCFEGCCSGLFCGNHCSSIEVDIGHGQLHEDDWCWEGEITITIMNNTNTPPTIEAIKKILITEGSPYYNVELLSEESEWKPDSPGSYDVTISYVGLGDSTTDDCENTVQVNFYGSGTYADLVGFNNDYWFDISNYDVPPYLQDAYFGAWRCGICDPDIEGGYVEENDQDKCSNFDNWQFTYFNYTPNNPLNPCDGGGTLQIMDFDDFGEAVIQEIEVPAGVSLYGLEGVQPFGSTTETWCYESGWCWFDPDIIYPEADLSHEILATWYNSESCESIVWDDPSWPNPDPCQDSNDCPEGLICIEGNCYQPCQSDDDCIFGNCIGGVCIEGDGCDPPCPEGYECHEGGCYLSSNICGFYDERFGGGSQNIYEFWHPDLPSGSEITISFTTYNIPDKLIVNGELIIDCISTGTDPFEESFITSGSSTTIEVYSCGSSSSKFKLQLSCPSLPFSGYANGYASNSQSGSYTEKLRVRPNPFKNSMTVQIHNYGQSFTGRVSLVDKLGRRHNLSTHDIVTGHNYIEISDLGGIPSGVYLLQILDGDLIYDQKRIIHMK